MMTKIGDGGAAFPLENAGISFREGMSFRDYAAVHANRPEQADLAAAAGLIISPTGYIPLEPGKLPVAFHEWWVKLLPETRYRLEAECRYAKADAMIKARGDG